MNKFLKNYRKLIGIYLFWVLINLILLCSFGQSRFAGDYFFPFEPDPLYYDISEFIIYTIAPIFVFCIYLCFKKEMKRFFKESKRKVKKFFKEHLILIGIYSIWITIHLVLLFGFGHIEADDYFFPFTKYEISPTYSINLESYELTETEEDEFLDKFNMTNEKFKSFLNKEEYKSLTNKGKLQFTQIYLKYFIKDHPVFYDLNKSEKQIFLDKFNEVFQKTLTLEYNSFADLRCYDISEFIIYCFMPMVIFIFYYAFFKKKKTRK